MVFVNDSDGGIDQSFWPAQVVSHGTFHSIDSAAVVHAHPKAAIPCFVEAQNLVMRQAIGGSEDSKRIRFETIQSTLPGAYPNHSGLVFQYGHNIVARKPFTRRVRSKTGGSQPI